MSPSREFGPSFSPLRRRCVRGLGYRKRAGFTLVEMVVVIGIVLIIMGIALPSVNTMWAQHRENDANNGISGMLMSTRAKAIQADRGEVGLFFYLDSKGVQQIALITRDPRIETDPTATPPTIAPNWRVDPDWRDVFTVAEDSGRALLAPMRVVPRYVVEADDPAKQSTTFSPIELGNEDFDNALALVIDSARRHRNYFTIIFSENGQLKVDGDVLIRDPDAESDNVGDITGLTVSDEVATYYEKNSTDSPLGLVDWVAIDPAANAPLVDVIVGADDLKVAVNFPGVDGVMVYDDSGLQTGGNDADKRQTLLETARPYYIHRLSGSVIRGPVGEVPPDEVTTP